MTSFTREHTKQTEELIKQISKTKIANWFLNEGYYPEQNVLPPCFRITGMKLSKNLFFKNPSSSKSQIRIHYPKSIFSSRVFSIQHPHPYHDIVFHLMDNWEAIIKKLFNEDSGIHSYSLPIPIDRTRKGSLGKLRTGRLIYEWVSMAEKDLIADAHSYSFIVKSDITNFYKSIYTHSISWAIHGYEEAFSDRHEKKLYGTKVDALFQMSNDHKTNGVPVGSALSDLIAEIILSDVDLRISKELKSEGIEFLATRFKDDYRFLCTTENEGKKIVKVLRDELEKFNLLINEEKTSIEKLPHGLYRNHDRDYYDYSLKKVVDVDFKKFELTLLKVLDIHRNYRGTSIIEKFLCELLDNKQKLKIKFTKKNKESQYKELIKCFSLLILLKRESPKALCHILSLIEVIFIKYHKRHKILKPHLKIIVKEEIDRAIKSKFAYELIWYIFFAQYLSLKLDYQEIKNSLDGETSKDLFLLSVLNSKQEFFKDVKSFKLFIHPKKSVKSSLAKTLSMFHRE